MSFLGSILASIGDEGSSKTSPAPLPTRAPTSNMSIRTASSIGAKKETPGKASVEAGQKRKAEDTLQQRPDKSSRSTPASPPSAKPISSAAQNGKPRLPTASSTTSGRPTVSSTASSARSSTSTPNAPAAAATPASSKPPPKGSFAELMARAKAAQESAPRPVGVIKHESKPKERISKTERRRREQEAREQEKAARLAKKRGLPPPTHNRQSPLNGKSKDSQDSGSDKKRGNIGTSYKGTARPPPDAAKPTSTSTYKGTAGIRRPTSANTSRPGYTRQYSRGRRDEYLATDEEDEGDGYGDEEDYYSDESEDMEAGAFDVEEEERRALRNAKKEDEEELKLEMRLKREKEERKRKLAALAAKSKR